jgi:hypothetical protein
VNQEDIIRMAQECGCWETDTGELVTDEIQLGRFAALVASAERESLRESFRVVTAAEASAAILHEREACAKVCEDLVPTYLKDGERWLKGRNGKPDSRLKDLAPNLEAAWEAEQLLKHKSVVEEITQAHICAEAIRARGQA